MKVTLMVCEVGHLERYVQKGQLYIRMITTTREELQSLQWQPGVGEKVPPAVVDYDELEDPPDDWRVVAVFQEDERLYSVLLPLLSLAEGIEGDTMYFERLFGKVGLGCMGIPGFPKA